MYNVVSSIFNTVNIFIYVDTSLPKTQFLLLALDVCELRKVRWCVTLKGSYEFATKFSKIPQYISNTRSIFSNLDGSGYFPA